MVPGDQEVELTSGTDELSRDRLGSGQITEAPAFVDPGGRHGAQHRQEPVMATVHIGADTDPHTKDSSVVGRRTSSVTSARQPQLLLLLFYAARRGGRNEAPPFHEENCHG